MKRLRRAARMLLACWLGAHVGCTSPATVAPVEAPPTDVESIDEVKERVQGPIRLPGGIIVDQDARTLRVPAEVAIDAGWLEQVVCRRGSREHESVLVVDVLPSQVHAGLILIGLNSGRPGYWEFEEDGTDRPKVVRVAPEGDLIEIEVAYQDADGERVVIPIRAWITRGEEQESFPLCPWVFGGSVFETVPSEEGSAEIYVADHTGSLVGLVTFGDEVLGLGTVLSEQVAVDPAEWEVRSSEILPPGTAVELVLRPWDPARKSPRE